MLRATASAAGAGHVDVDIDLSEQKMTVRLDSRTLYYWPVSTARNGYRTPIGTFRPYRMDRTWYSRKYDYAPMPYSIFFYGGYAIHGTTEISRLGRPVSHGCIRLHPEHARLLFELVRQVGMGNTRIVIRP
ncbi:MAG: L,D-transpeptidase [Oricola sp.]